MSTLATATHSATITPTDAALLIPVHPHSKLHCEFSATTFAQSECDDIDKKFRSTIIAKMGFCSKTATAIVNGGCLYGGLQIPSSWDLQGANHFQLLVGHPQLQDLLGKCLLHTINLLCLHIGLPERPLSHNIDLTKNVAPPSWVTNTWTCASSIQATVLTDSFQLSPQRKNDSSIMEMASQFHSGITHERINNVRKFQQLFHISDIATALGHVKAINKAAQWLITISKLITFQSC